MTGRINLKDTYDNFANLLNSIDFVQSGEPLFFQDTLFL